MKHHAINLPKLISNNFNQILSVKVYYKGKLIVTMFREAHRYYTRGGHAFWTAGQNFFKL